MNRRELFKIIGGAIASLFAPVSISPIAARSSWLEKTAMFPLVETNVIAYGGTHWFERLVDDDGNIESRDVFEQRLAEGRAKFLGWTAR
jgi:hypothetical protein